MSKNSGNKNKQAQASVAPAEKQSGTFAEVAKAAAELQSTAGDAMQAVVEMDKAKADANVIDAEAAAAGDATAETGTGEDLSNLPPATDESDVGAKAEPDVQTSAPAATNQGVKEIKVGVVVDSKDAKLNKEAPEAVKQAISQQTTAKPVDHSTPFEQKLAKIIAGDNGRLRDLALQLQAYVKAMAPGVPLTPEEGARQQQALFRIMKNVVEQDDSFKEAFRLVISFYKEYKTTVFSPAYVHRFHSDVTLSPSDATALTRLVNLFSIAAGVSNKSEVSRLVNLNATFNTGLSDSARDRVVQYFNT